MKKIIKSLGKTKNNQKGFGIIAVVFVVAIALVLVLAAALTLGTRSRSTVLAFKSSQAYFAAQGGIEVGSGMVLTAGCSVLPPVLLLGDFSVDMTCESLTVNEDPQSYQIYFLTASARQGNWTDGTLVSKTVRATLTEF